MFTLSEEADRIEKQIISDFEDDATVVIDSIIGYLQEIKKGELVEEADCLYSIIEQSINCLFNNRYKSINRFINGAIRWKAEHIAIEEEKLTRPMP